MAATLPSAPTSSIETIRDFIATPLQKLPLPTRVSVPPTDEPSHALKLAVNIDPQRGLNAMYTTAGVFKSKIRDYISRFPTTPISQLPAEAREPNFPTQFLSVFPAARLHPIEHTKLALQCGVLESMRGVLHTVFRKQFIASHDPPASREPFFPHRPRTQEDIRRETEDEERRKNWKPKYEFQWDLHPCSYVRDADQTIGMFSWSSEPVLDPSVPIVFEDGVEVNARDKNIDCRVLFFVFGAWEVNDYDFKNFATQRTLRNRANVRGVVKRYPAEGDRMWGLIYDRCYRAKCRWFVVTTHDNWSFGVFSKEWTTAFLTDPLPYNSGPSFDGNPGTGETDPTILQSLIYWVLSAMGANGAWDIDEVGKIQADFLAPSFLDEVVREGATKTVQRDEDRRSRNGTRGTTSGVAAGELKDSRLVRAKERKDFTKAIRQAEEAALKHSALGRKGSRTLSRSPSASARSSSASNSPTSFAHASPLLPAQRQSSSRGSSVASSTGAVACMSRSASPPSRPRPLPFSASSTLGAKSGKRKCETFEEPAGSGSAVDPTSSSYGPVLRKRRRTPPDRILSPTPVAPATSSGSSESSRDSSPSPLPQATSTATAAPSSNNSRLSITPASPYIPPPVLPHSEGGSPLASPLAPPPSSSIQDWIPKPKHHDILPLGHYADYVRGEGWKWLRTPLRCFPLKVGDFFGASKAAAMAISRAR